MRPVIKLLLSGLLSGCVQDDANPKYRYSCAFIKTCGEHGYFTREEFYDTVENVQEISREWAHACRILTEHEVVNGDCPFILCGSICTPVED